MAALQLCFDHFVTYTTNGLFLGSLEAELLLYLLILNHPLICQVYNCPATATGVRNLPKNSFYVLK